MRWDIATTAFEPTAVTLGFLAHHILLGVHKIWLFLDAPNPELEAIVAGHAQVNLVHCDDVYWRASEAGKQPEDFRDRQILNANYAKSQSDADWIFHIDADEYLIELDELLAFLQAQPDDVLTVVLQNIERVLRRGRPAAHIFEGDFRIPKEHGLNPQFPVIYGRYIKYLRKGIAGYWQGKAVTRTSANLRILHHRATLPKDVTLEGYEKVFAKPAVLHFDGMTQAHWIDKMRKKFLQREVSRPKLQPRRMQIKAILDNDQDPSFLDDLYLHVKTIGPVQRLLLRILRLFMLIPIDIPAEIDAVFPDVQVDLSPQAVDRALADIQTGRVPGQF